MQNAWRFVENEVLRERLKDAKGIGTPATRAEIISGLKKQGFLAAQGKNVVPTERGLALFGVLGRADPALVDPGVTAELECLLDDVLTGRQEMMGAIDAVCDSARRIIGKLAARGSDGETLVPGEAPGGGDRPPTAAMRKYAASIAKRKGIKPPRGYTKSAAVCRAFPRPAWGRAEPGTETGVPRGRADAWRLRGWKAGERRDCTVRQRGKVAAGETAAAAEISTRHDKCVGRRPAVERRVADAASYSIRKQGPGIRPGRQIWRGRLVCAARRRSRCFRERGWL